MTTKKTELYKKNKAQQAKAKRRHQYYIIYRSYARRFIKNGTQKDLDWAKEQLAKYSAK